MTSKNNACKIEIKNLGNLSFELLSRPHRIYSESIMDPKSTTIQEMYTISNRKDSNWGVDGYEVHKTYFDPIKQIKEREPKKQTQGGKNKKIRQKETYLDEYTKIHSKIPAPNQYNQLENWKDSKQSTRKPRSAPAKRMTFIDQISKEQKARPKPGVGKYNLEMPMKEKEKQIEELKKKKITYQERPIYLDEYQFLSNIGPGPGEYNHRKSCKQIQLNRTKPSDYIEKHKAFQKKHEKSSTPDPGTYTPLTSQSFQKLFEAKKKKEETPTRTIQNFWGKETRFKDPTKSKSQLNIIVPGPGQYPLIAKWIGKEEAKDKDNKDKNWMNTISKISPRSIYY